MYISYPLSDGGCPGGGGGGGGDVTRDGSVLGLGITDSYIGSLSFIMETFPFGIIPLVSSGGVVSVNIR